MVTSSRFQLVDSLYGPGAVDAWLMTLCSVLVSWTLSLSSRRKDTVSVDLIAALLLPLVSAGHLFFQLRRLPVSVADAITTQDVELQMYASALEAPLNVCETFSIAALALALCCGPWWNGFIKYRRLSLVVVAGLISWGTENVMFMMATMKGVRVADATLSRPYLFFLTPIVASTWAFLALCCVAGGFVWLISKMNARTARKPKVDPERVVARIEVNKRLQRLENDIILDRLTPDEIEKMYAQLQRLTQERYLAQEPTERSVVTISYLTGVFLPLAFVTSFFGIDFSQTKDSSTLYNEKFFVIPKSDTSVTNLDQILALIGGAIVLLAALWDVYRGRWRSASKKTIERRRSI